MSLRRKVMKAKAPPVKRKAVQAPNAAAAQRIKFDRGVVTAIRDTRAQVGALADAVENVQAETTAKVGQMMNKAVRRVQAAVKAAPPPQPAPAIPAPPSIDLGKLAAWNAERETARRAARVQYDQDCAEAEAKLREDEESMQRSIKHLWNKDMRDTNPYADAWERSYKPLSAAYHAALDAAADRLFDAFHAADVTHLYRWHDPIAVVSSDDVMAEWERARAALNMYWEERRTYYNTDAALDAGYERFSAGWDAQLAYAQARWEAAKAHEDRIAPYPPEAKDTRELSEMILRLQFRALAAGIKLTGPFDGPCAFTLSNGESMIGGLRHPAFVKAYNVLLDAVQTAEDLE